MTDRASSDASVRVLHVMGSLGVGGAERAVFQLIRGQREVGIDAAVLVTGRPGLYGERLREEGVEVVALGRTSAFDLRDAWRLREIFTRWPTVHFHGPEPFLMIAAVRAGVRAHYTHRAGTFSYPLRRRLRYWVTGAIVRRRFVRVAGNTSHAATVVAGMFGVDPQHVATVYNGIDWELLQSDADAVALRERLQIAPDAIVIGTSANLRAWKRIDLLVRCLEHTPTAVLLVIGDGPEQEPLKLLSRSLGVDGRTHFVGRQENVVDYLQLCDVFALPSGPEESFGNSAVEAMGLGIPTIVLSDGGGLVEHVSHLETGIVARDQADLACWVARLVDDPVLRQTLGMPGQDAVRQRYTVDRMVAGYSNLYSSNRP